MDIVQVILKIGAGYLYRCQRFNKEKKQLHTIFQQTDRNIT